MARIPFLLDRADPHPRELLCQAYRFLQTCCAGRTSMSVVLEKNSRQVVFPLAILPSIQI